MIAGAVRGVQYEDRRSDRQDRGAAHLGAVRSVLPDIVAHQPTGQQIHVIADNLSAHKTKRVEAFLSEHPTVQLHFTPTYSSWLNHR